MLAGAERKMPEVRISLIVYMKLLTSDVKANLVSCHLPLPIFFFFSFSIITREIRIKIFFISCTLLAKTMMSIIWNYTVVTQKCVN